MLIQMAPPWRRLCRTVSHFGKKAGILHQHERPALPALPVLSPSTLRSVPNSEANLPGPWLIGSESKNSGRRIGAR
jgi:hypothetical protein